MKEKVFIITKDYVKAVKDFLSTKSWNEANQAFFAVKEEMTESQLNDLLGFIGQYPIREVEQFFVAARDHIKEKVEETQEAAPEVVDEKDDDKSAKNSKK